MSMYPFAAASVDSSDFGERIDKARRERDRQQEEEAIVKDAEAKGENFQPPHFPGQNPGQMHTQLPRRYNDHILSITDRSCADPFVIYEKQGGGGDGGKGVFYMTFTADGNRVEIWSADSLFDFEARCKKDVIWRPPRDPDTEYTGDIWAPELHSLDGRWYVFFAADHPAFGNRTHRMFVLRGPPSTSSPLNAEDWAFHGALGGMRDGQWAIDGTVIHLHSKRYFVYSGWPLGQTLSSSKQELFIIEMEDATTCKGAPIRISTPDYQWEFSGKSGINEGPQWLASPDGRWKGIAYSCAGSWTSEYKMNVLEFNGGDPLVPGSWQKWSRPLIKASRDDEPPYGPGHGNFVEVDGPGGGKEVWAVFHATDGKTGWGGRRARVMRVGWGDKGPFMGNGECGRCSGDVAHFLYGCPGSGKKEGEKCECGGPKKGGPGGVGGGGGAYHNGTGVDVVKNRVVGEVKGFLGKVFK